MPRTKTLASPEAPKTLGQRMVRSFKYMDKLLSDMTAVMEGGGKVSDFDIKLDNLKRELMSFKAEGSGGDAAHIEIDEIENRLSKIQQLQRVIEKEAEGTYEASAVLPVREEQDPFPQRAPQGIEEFIEERVANNTLTLGDLKLAAAELGKEIRKAERAGTTEGLEPKRQMLKRLEIAEKSLLTEATTEQARSANRIIGFGTDAATKISERPFHEISAAEAVRQADPSTWTEETEDMVPTHKMARPTAMPVNMPAPAKPSLFSRLGSGIKSLFKRAA